MVLVALVIGIILIVVGGIINAISYEGGYVYQVVGGFLLGSAVIGLIICGGILGAVPEYNKQIEVYETEMKIGRAHV